MNLKKYLPYAVAIVLFAIINVIQFSPMFSGKTLMQGDIVRFKGTISPCINVWWNASLSNLNTISRQLVEQY